MTKRSDTSKDKRRGDETTKPARRSAQSAKPPRNNGALSEAQLDQVSAGAGSMSSAGGQV